ncbi:MAG TPA: SLC13 family permease, partial [Woeseiaceae bacterium]|nr:SLC13 family permease [Woeseiaceae bacterium]
MRAMPPAPDPHALFAIALALIAIVLYTREKIPLESSSLLILLVLLIWFESSDIEHHGIRVEAGDFLAAFGNEALIAVISLMILTRSLEVTGALQPIGHVLARLWRKRPKFAFLVTLLTAAALSMFLNNTPVVAAVMPLLVSVSLQAKMSASSILMPVGFATIVGGMSTTIGTSTNLLVVSIAHDLGMREMQMFDFALPVFIVGSVAIAYLWLIAPHLLPERKPPLTDVAPRLFDSRLRINLGSRSDGLSLGDVLALAKGRPRIRRIVRGELSLARLPSVTVKAGDYLHISDTLENMKEFEHLLGATLVMADTDQPVDEQHRPASDQHMAEVVVMRGSKLDQRTLHSSRILSSYGLQPLALHRPGHHADAQSPALSDVVLRAGDVIVLQGSSAGIDRLKRSGQALVLDGNIDLPRPAKASLALLITAGVVLVAGLGLVRISLAAVAGIMAMIATGCLSWNEVRGAIDRRFILVIVTSLGLGLALTSTGAAEYIAQLYVAMTDGLSVALILCGLILIMALLTEVATNNAIAVLGTPIAISIAAALGAPAEPFVLAVLYGANMSYLTPVGYQT